MKTPVLEYRWKIQLEGFILKEAYFKWEHGTQVGSVVLDILFGNLKHMDVIHCGIRSMFLLLQRAEKSATVTVPTLRKFNFTCIPIEPDSRLFQKPSEIRLFPWQEGLPRFTSYHDPLECLLALGSAPCMGTSILFRDHSHLATPLL